MKVLVVGTGGGLSGSGITTAADQMVRTLQHMGHDAQRLVAGARFRQRPNRLNFENLMAVIVEAVSLARAARASRPDVIWLHTFGVPTLPALRTLTLVIAARLLRRRVVVHFHAFGLEDHVANASRVQRTTLRLVGRLSAALVAVHEAAVNALRPFAAGKAFVLHNWVEVPVDPVPPPSSPPFTAVFVGGLVERKGLPQLLAAMRTLADVPLTLRVVGGPGDDGPAAAVELQHDAADLVDRGAVVFVGPQSGAEVRKELQASHLFVLPSRAEGMPLAMLESLAEGRPALVGDAGNMAEIVAGLGCGWVLSDREPTTIATALRMITRDSTLLAEIGRRAHAVAGERFSDVAARKVIEHILAVLRIPGAGYRNSDSNSTLGNTRS